MARVKFIKIKGVSNQVSSNSDHKAKSYLCSSSNTKVGKNEKVKKNSGLQNGASRGLQIGAGFMGLQIGERGITNRAALGISNRGKKITNRGRDFKSGQRDFKSGQRLQIGARGISVRGRDYKSVQNNRRTQKVSRKLG